MSQLYNQKPDNRRMTWRKFRNHKERLKEEPQVAWPSRIYILALRSTVALSVARAVIGVVPAEVISVKMAQSFGSICMMTSVEPRVHKPWEHGCLDLHFKGCPQRPQDPGRKLLWLQGLLQGNGHWSRPPPSQSGSATRTRFKFTIAAV